MIVIYHNDVLLVALYINIVYFFVVWLYNASCSVAVEAPHHMHIRSVALQPQFKNPEQHLAVTLMTSQQKSTNAKTDAHTPYPENSSPTHQSVTQMTHTQLQAMNYCYQTQNQSQAQHSNQRMQTAVISYHFRTISNPFKTITHSYTENTTVTATHHQ